ncbi:hypothetical protein F0562_029616 [Nyssa sinensis]|uniref:Uncharacterized protein n=1 Tax=Nyssa sinensis TaxID=561372 RepID=A0A5J5B3H9_9ASTE|nr:hypothetical protein F0562_029616 [Nyssa sinensis]
MCSVNEIGTPMFDTSEVGGPTTGGMTKEKKVQRQKALAKWLKENILRLGPTFIKIGQQFSTRVDILAQEYVDQLSELQDQVPPFPSDTAISVVSTGDHDGMMVVIEVLELARVVVLALVVVRAVVFTEKEGFL